MIEKRVLTTLEYNKILALCAKYAVLDFSKQIIEEMTPSDDFEEVNFLLKKTAEAHKLLFTHGASGIEFFDPISDELDRAKRGSVLSMGEILRIARILRSSRVVYNSITSVTDEEIVALRSIAESIYFDKYLEEDITNKILFNIRIITL